MSDPTPSQLEPTPSQLNEREASSNEYVMGEPHNVEEPRLSNRMTNELDQQKLEELFNTYDKSTYEKGGLFGSNPHPGGHT